MGADRRRWYEVEDDRHVLRFELSLRDGSPVTVDKTVAVVTSRDAAIASPGAGALAEGANVPIAVHTAVIAAIMMAGRFVKNELPA